MATTKELIRIDKNGTKYYEGLVPCPRCGGKGGANIWQYTGWTCYQCNGSGVIHDTWKEYTPEYEAKLKEQRVKRAEKKEKKLVAEALLKADEKRAEFLSKNGFSSEGIAYVVLGNTYPIKNELKEKGAKFNPILGWHFDSEVEGYKLMGVDLQEVAEPNHYYTWYWKDNANELVENLKKISNSEISDIKDSNYIGEINGKIENLKVKLFSIKGYEAPAFNGYGLNWINIYSFSDKDGNVLVWKTSSFIEGAEENKEYIINATIKDHKVYNDVKQTILKRCKVQEIN